MKKKRNDLREFHPYGEYRSKKIGSLILGTFPIGKFSNPKRRHEIKHPEIDFYYGGKGNQLWKLLGLAFLVKLETKEDIVSFLEREHFSIADVIQSCRRIEGGGSDSDLYDIEWNPRLHDFIATNKFKKIYFTSMNVYRWYVRHIGRVDGPEEIILLSPSASGVRSFPGLKEFKEWAKTVDIEKKATVFRELHYKKVFGKEKRGSKKNRVL